MKWQIQKEASRWEGYKLCKLSAAHHVLHSPVAAQVCPALCSAGTPGWARAPAGGGGPGGDQQVLGTGLQAGGAPGPHSSGQLCWRLPRRQSRLTREESLVGQGGEGWEKGDKGPGLAMVCRHHFLASNTKLKQAGEALAPTPGVGGASRLASALS